MRVLWLTQSYEVHAFDLLAESLRKYLDVDLISLTSDEQENLARTFRCFDFSRYDRVMTTLRTKKEIRQWRVLRSINNLVIFEYDACQNYLAGGKYKGLFSLYYRRLGGPRLIVSGAGVANKLKDEGFDANFMPKGYDSRVIQNFSGVERDIPIGFIGRLDADAYEDRKKFIERQVVNHGLKVLRTSPGTAYAQALARIRIFVSADIGLGEYMAKNFEAMAAGCVLMTYDQGERENRAIGFVDMENVVLFRDQEEFDVKLGLLLRDPSLVESISKKGACFSRKSFSYDNMGGRLADILLEPLWPRSASLSWRDRLGWI